MKSLYSFILFLLVSACTTTSTPLNGAQLLDAGFKMNPNIQQEWQQTFLNQFKKDSKATYAVGLFTAGGWSNAGQLMIMDQGGDSLRLLFASPGLNANEIDRLQLTSIPRKEVDFNYIEKAMKLEPLDQVSFDNLRWEVVFLKRVPTILGDTIKIFSLYINTTEREKYLGHNKLLATLEKLVPKERGAK